MAQLGPLPWGGRAGSHKDATEAHWIFHMGSYLAPGVSTEDCACLCL